MILIIPKKSTVIYLWENRKKAAYCMVSYTEEGDTIRIISSRELVAGEREAYEEG